MQARVNISSQRLLRKHIALPQQHGSWALWLGPYAVGVGVAGALNAGLAWVTLATLGAFLALQPLTILVKILAGRRPATDRAPALFWLAVYSGLVAIGAVGMAASGFGYVLPLGLIAAPVLIWQMALVYRHEERHNLWVEVAGAAVLALAAPAGYWVAGAATEATPTGWLLWLLCALQGFGAIVYVYLRLAHRRLSGVPSWPVRWRMALPAIAANGANVVIAAGLAVAGLIPIAAIALFGLMLGEALYGGLGRIGVGVKPVVIGVRQVIVTAIFSLLLILAYRLG